MFSPNIMKYSSVRQYLESAQAVLVLSSIKLENEIRLQLAAENMQKSSVSYLLT